MLQKQYELPLIVSTHPHTRTRLESFGIAVSNSQIRLLEPFGFFDFVALEQQAGCVLSDSGTVQEEYAILKCRMSPCGMSLSARKQLNAGVTF